MKTSIFYYTNNLLPPNLLKNTLNATVDHAIRNNCELIITSHYPLVKNYISQPLTNGENYTSIVDPITREASKSKLYDHIVSGNILETDYPVKNYVVGKLPYNFTSIIWQILLSLNKCSHNDVIFMESDCFYPKNYVEVTKNKLTHLDMTYCFNTTCFLGINGFYKLRPTVFLSTFSGKREVFRRIFERKLNLSTNGAKFVLEPIVDTMDNYQDFIKQDPLTTNCSFLSECDLDGPILDVRHRFNLANAYSVSSDNYFPKHYYWGEAQKYIDMLGDSDIDATDAIDSKLWHHGLANLNY